jgi:two-component system, cell cycle response regulator
MGKKVLTIDDSQTVRTIIKKHLSQFSIQVFEAEDGEKGVSCARESLPDLILLDYNMPIMDGYHTLVELRSDPRLKPIPVVMVTTETSKETVIKLLRLGLNDYIAKPFTRDILVKKINPFLKLYEGDTIPAPTPAPAVSAVSHTTAPVRESVAPVKTISNPLVLAVDDKASVRELLKEYLVGQQELIMADSGRAALAAFDQKDFDFIFLDLDMPDMSGFDVLNEYLKKMKDGASVKKIIAMTLRSAQQDIHRASELGISAILFKPFTRADVEKALEQVVAGQNIQTVKKLQYLTTNGRLMTLECPAQRSSRFRFFAESLASEIPQEIERMIEDGSDRLIVKIGDGLMENHTVGQNFLKLMRIVNDRRLAIRFVADSPESRDMLKQFRETANIPMDVSLECALNAIAC